MVLGMEQKASLKVVIILEPSCTTPAPCLRSHAGSHSLACIVSTSRHSQAVSAAHEDSLTRLRIVKATQESSFGLRVPVDKVIPKNPMGDITQINWKEMQADAEYRNKVIYIFF